MTRTGFARLVLAAAVGAAMMAQGSLGVDRARPTPQQAGMRVCVVELFTSEGCSSCPPADVLLAKLDAEYRAAGKSVVFLAEHVDYWDYLGWKDPFASKEFSARQRAYAGVVKGESGVYTPQMVVDGRVGFVGSDAARARGAIDSAVGGGQRVDVQLTVAPRTPGGPIRCEVKAGTMPAGAGVLVALVENGLSSEVKRGENGGRTLKHERVVRVLARAAKAGDALMVEIKPPADLDEANARVVAFVQEDAGKGILGASEVALASPAKIESGRTEPRTP